MLLLLSSLLLVVLLVVVIGLRLALVVTTECLPIHLVLFIRLHSTYIIMLIGIKVYTNHS